MHGWVWIPAPTTGLTLHMGDLGTWTASRLRQRVCIVCLQLCQSACAWCAALHRGAPTNCRAVSQESALLLVPHVCAVSVGLPALPHPTRLFLKHASGSDGGLQTLVSDKHMCAECAG
jgi:hypothetical protein